RIIGPSSAVTRCSPTKNDDSPYMRWKRSSSSIRSCQSIRSCVKSRSCVAQCWRSHNSYSCLYVSRCDSPRSAEASSAGSPVAWKSVRCVRSLMRARLLPDWPVSQSELGPRFRPSEQQRLPVVAEVDHVLALAPALQPRAAGAARVDGHRLRALERHDDRVGELVVDDELE